MCWVLVLSSERGKQGPYPHVVNNQTGKQSKYRQGGRWQLRQEYTGCQRTQTRWELRASLKKHLSQVRPDEQDGISKIKSQEKACAKDDGQKRKWPFDGTMAEVSSSGTFRFVPRACSDAV